MWKNKKLIVVSLVVAVVALVGIGGVALAQDEDTPTTGPGALLDRIVSILNNEGVDITAEQLQGAFSQATHEMQAEARDKHLQAMVEAGRITQEQAREFKAWMDSKPEGLQGFGFGGHKGFGRMRRFSGFPGMPGCNLPAPPAE